MRKPSYIETGMSKSLKPAFQFYNLNPASDLKLWEAPKPWGKSLLDFERSLKKALSGHFDTLLFDETALHCAEIEGYFEETIKAKLKIAIQMTGADFKKHIKKLSLWRQKYSSVFWINILFEKPGQLNLKEMEAFLPHLLLTLMVTKANRKTPYKEGLPPQLWDKIELYFPYKEHIRDAFLTPRQVCQFVKKQGPIPPLRRDIFDRRIPPDLDLEPCLRPLRQNRLPQTDQKILFSIIIPSYNNGPQLIETLKALSLQTYPRDKYEIIAVDDGSKDHTKTHALEFIQQNPGLNLTLLHCPRVTFQGPGRFRAGIARNLGAKHSRGRLLLFLDADILTPPGSLARLEKEHEKADLIMLKRHHLKFKAPDPSRLLFDHERLKPYTYIEERRYWESFYKKGFSGTKSPWKYVCSYGLGLSKKDFEAAGRFGKNFCFYGFEDTDLGWRLFKAGKTFLLSDINVYHQPPLKKAWERRGYFHRHRQLSKTAKIFFYRHFDPAIYKEMKTYMAQERGLAYFFPFLKKAPRFKT